MTPANTETATHTTSAASTSWRAVMQLIRLPNCFTAVPDALAGAFVALWLLGADPTSGTAVELLALAGAIGFLAYLGGVTMNDLVDRRHDAAHRPERPLPSGRVRVGHAVMLTVVPFVLVLLVAASRGMETLAVASGLLALIVLYNVVHKKIAALGLPLMGLARGANVLTGFAVVAAAASFEMLGTHIEAWVVPAGLTLWVLSVSVVAKFEGRARFAVRLVPRMLLAIPVLDALLLGLVTGLQWPVALLVVAIWILPATWLARTIRMS